MQISKKKYISLFASLVVGVLFSISLLYHVEIGQNTPFVDKFIFCIIAAIPVAILLYSLIEYLILSRLRSALILILFSLVAAAILVIGLNFSIPIPKIHELTITSPAQNGSEPFLEVRYLENVSHFQKIIYFNKAKFTGNFETQGAEVEKVTATLRPGSSASLSFYAIGDLRLITEVSKCPSGISITWDKKKITDEICSYMQNGIVYLPEGNAEPQSRKWIVVSDAIKGIDILLIALAIYAVLRLLGTLRKKIIQKGTNPDLVIVEPMGWFLHIFIYTTVFLLLILLLAFFMGESEIRAFIPVVVFVILDCAIYLFDKKRKLKQPAAVLLGAACLAGILLNLFYVQPYRDIESYQPKTFAVLSNSFNDLTHALNVDTRDMYTIILSYDKALYQRDVKISQSIANEMIPDIEYLKDRSRAASVEVIPDDPQIDQATSDCLIQQEHITKTSVHGKTFYFIDISLYKNGDSVRALEFGGNIVFFPASLIAPEGKCNQ